MGAPTLAPLIGTPSPSWVPPVPRRVWVFWFGPPIEGARQRAWRTLVSRIGVEVKLVTEENLASFQVPNSPFHPTIALLSPVQRSDYLWAYFGHHYGGGFHDVKPPSGNWTPHFELLEGDPVTWILGTPEGSRGGVACQESMAADDPLCLALRRTRNETATRFESVKPEYPTSFYNQTDPSYDYTRGACCERVRDNWRSLVDVQQFIMRPFTPLSSDWLRLIHTSLSRKASDIAAHPYPHARCCMNHENGYPVNWAELKGNTIQPLMLMHRAHVRGGLPPHSGVYRSSGGAENEPLHKHARSNVSTTPLHRHARLNASTRPASHKHARLNASTPRKSLGLFFGFG